MTKKNDDRVTFRKQNSGAKNREIKESKDAMTKSLKGSILKLYKARDKKTQSLCMEEALEEPNNVDENEVNEEILNGTPNFVNEVCGEKEKESRLDFEKDVDINYDPGLWGDISDTKRILLVQRGPIKILKNNDEFPRDLVNGRSFSSRNYIRHQPNREKQERKWLVYSNELNKVFCFCCKLFKNRAMNSSMTDSGLDNWHNISTKLQSHERNPEHKENVVKWVDLKKGLNLKATVDKAMEVHINLEKGRWKMILVRIIGIVKLLAKNSLPFRGTNEKIYEKNNGLFCQVIEFVAEFDLVIQEHLRRVIDKEIQHHYLIHKIQNELITLLANEIRKNIIEKIKKAKYFSIILDCTPDVSHEEQMSIIIRCVDVEVGSKTKVEEFFLGFIKVVDTSCLGLFKAFKNTLIDLGLDINDIRGQGYDNGANMKGNVKWVQSRLLKVNPRAIYVPCGCHSLNLALCDMVKSCGKARDFFAYVQKIYTLFSGSIQRWAIFEKIVKNLTVKPLSVTRWESHIERIKSIRMQAPQIRDALIDIANSAKEDVVMAEAKGLCKNALEDFEFLISLCVWYKVLDKINRVSKMLQDKEMNLEEAIKRINELVLFFRKFRIDGFGNLMEEAEALANEIGIDPVFPQKRVVRRSKHFDDDVETETEGSQTPKDKFMITFFLHIIDQALVYLEDRFEHFSCFEENFGFLFIGKLRNIDDGNLKKHCVMLESFLKDGEHYDIDANELFGELKDLKLLLPKEVTKSVEVLDFMRSYWEDGSFVNTWITCRILLTIPVTVASAERSFSKLKLIKNYLRSTMSQERLSGLALISIESEMLEDIKYEQVIEEFASKNSRRSIFL